MSPRYVSPVALAVVLRNVVKPVLPLVFGRPYVVAAPVASDAMIYLPGVPA